MITGHRRGMRLHGVNHSQKAVGNPQVSLQSKGSEPRRASGGEFGAGSKVGESHGLAKGGH